MSACSHSTPPRDDAAPEAAATNDDAHTADTTGDAPDGSAASGDPSVDASGGDGEILLAPKHYKVVVQTGDSMVGGGLCAALAPKFKAEGTRFVRDVWEASSLTAFATTDRLNQLMKRHDPDLVIITLGANDVFHPTPKNLAPYIETIVKRVGKRDCYWIGPPLWKPDMGLNEVLREHTAPCRFFDSSVLHLPRMPDGIHPNAKGGAAWADAFWAELRGDAGDAGAPLLP